MKGRTESEAFLAWFLENFYHLDSVEVDDAICDGAGDKGVDGIYVSVLREQIDVFQTALGHEKGQTTPTRGIEEGKLKEFIATLKQFDTPESVARMTAEASPRLRRLLERLNVEARVAQGFEVRGVFVTTRFSHKNLKSTLASSPNVVCYDFNELQSQFLPIEKAEPISKPITFDVSIARPLAHQIEGGPKMYIALVPASDLVRMGGIQNQELFAWNLRYSLRTTSVNKAIDDTIDDPKQHKNFPAFHNGLTVLANSVKLSRDKKKLTINGYSVVNGCQSLNALYHKRGLLTPDLQILTKFVAVSPKGALAQTITDRTNRQNGITGRDLQSNNSIQSRLQTEIHEKYKGQVYYRIARGEHSEWPAALVIENDAAAKALLAFDCKEPESCHQHYKLFEEFHSKIFAAEHVNADRIVMVRDLELTIREVLETMKDRGFASYSLTPYLFLFLLRNMLETNECGARGFCENPSLFMSEPRARERIRDTMRPYVEYLAKIVAALLEQRKERGEEFDYKRDLKSKVKIHDVKNSISPHYEMAYRVEQLRPFDKVWGEWQHQFKLVP